MTTNQGTAGQGVSADAMVERVHAILNQSFCHASGTDFSGRVAKEVTKAALEASHHAELVEALRWATDRLKAVGHGWTNAEMEPVEALLANGHKPVDLYQQLYSLPEPEKNEFRFIIIGAASAVLWVAIYVIWGAL